MPIIEPGAAGIEAQTLPLSFCAQRANSSLESESHLVDLSLLDDVIRIGSGKTSRLKEVHNLRPEKSKKFQSAPDSLISSQAAQPRFILFISEQF